MQILGTAINIARLVVVTCVALAVSNLMSWGKRRERQHFSDTVSESILRKQIMSARNVSDFLTELTRTIRMEIDQTAIIQIVRHMS